MSGWIGVDLDRTLAKFDGWVSETHIGEPIPEMVRIVQAFLAAGQEVRIFTARAYRVLETEGYIEQAHPICLAIHAWCLRHIGQELAVTCIKDLECERIYDDIAVQVIPNTGILVRGSN